MTRPVPGLTVREVRAWVDRLCFALTRGSFVEAVAQRAAALGLLRSSVIPVHETADPIARWCGAAAVGGGAMWAAKGLAILVTGDQPPLLFELPVVLFPIGLLGLNRRLRAQEERRRRFGAALAWVALGTAAATAITLGVAGEDAPGVLVGAGMALSALATVVGLVLLGLAAKRAQLFPGRWRSFAFVLGLSIAPGITVVGGVLEGVHERLLEVPLVAIAFGWIVLGALVAFMPGSRQEAPSTR